MSEVKNGSDEVLDNSILILTELKKALKGTPLKIIRANEFKFQSTQVSVWRI